MAPDDRPRERLLKAGASSLRNAELVAILLRTGTKGRSAIEVADDLLDCFGSLEALARAPIQEIASINGIGQTKAILLNAAFSLGARRSRSVAESQRMDSPKAICALLGDEMRLLDHECVRVLTVNTKMCLLAVDEISRGSLDESLCSPRDVFRPALARQAFGVIAVHNHPSGDPAPSRADRDITRRLKQSGDLLNVEFLDHIILGAPREDDPDAYFSFRERGYL